MRIGLFGGSFDPIHFGHITPVQQARRDLGLDRVIYLPTACPPHKIGRQFAPAHARYAMVELALLREEGLYASSIELTPREPAYTIDSVGHFQRRWPEAELYLLIGGDAFAELTTWKRWRELAASARLAVLVRPAWRLEEMRPRLGAELVELIDRGRVDFVANQPVETSSTRLRELLAAEAEVPPGAVPELVLEYLRKYRPYQ